MSWDEGEFTRVAPRDALSPQYPRAHGVVFEPPAPGYGPLETIARYLETDHGVRAWLGWMADDGFVRVIARLPPTWRA